MGISPFQIVLILLLGVLIFGKNLPDVAKQIGLGLMEFKKGMKEIKDVKTTGRTSRQDELDRVAEEPDETDKHELIGTKFQPPTMG